MAQLVALVIKNLPANSRDTRDSGSIPGSERSSGERNGSPLQYSCLGNPMDRGAWWATVHWVAESDNNLAAKLQKHELIFTSFLWFVLFIIKSNYNFSYHWSALVISKHKARRKAFNSPRGCSEEEDLQRDDS